MGGTRSSTTPAAGRALSSPPMSNRPFVPAVLFLAAVALTGCASNGYDKDTKREMDRLAIDLSRAQKDRDQYKAQLETAKADAAQNEKALAAARQELAEAQNRL